MTLIYLCTVEENKPGAVADVLRRGDTRYEIEE